MLQQISDILGNVPHEYLIYVIFAISFTCVLLSELVSCLLSYCRKDIRELSDRLAVISNTLKSSDGKDGKGKKINRDELIQEFEKKNSQLMQKMIPSYIAPIPIMFLSVSFILKRLPQTVVAYLPFKPFSLLARFLHQGLDNVPDNAVSTGFFYFFCMAINRFLVRNFIPHVYMPNINEMKLFEKNRSKSK